MNKFTKVSFCESVKIKQCWIQGRGVVKTLLPPPYFWTKAGVYRAEVLKPVKEPNNILRAAPLSIGLDPRS